jgi:DNA-binding NtrC family response regulator
MERRQQPRPAVDVRLIAATQRRPAAEAAARRFSHDLLDRLSFEVSTVPPCGPRVDIPPAGRTLRRARTEAGVAGLSGVGERALSDLLDYVAPATSARSRNVAERPSTVGRRAGADRRHPFDPFDSPFRPPRRSPRGMPHRQSLRPCLNDRWLRDSSVICGPPWPAPNGGCSMTP